MQRQPCSRTRVFNSWAQLSWLWTKVKGKLQVCGEFYAVSNPTSNYVHCKLQVFFSKSHTSFTCHLLCKNPYTHHYGASTKDLLSIRKGRFWETIFEAERNGAAEHFLSRPTTAFAELVDLQEPCYPKAMPHAMHEAGSDHACSLTGIQLPVFHLWPLMLMLLFAISCSFDKELLQVIYSFAL